MDIVIFPFLFSFYSLIVGNIITKKLFNTPNFERSVESIIAIIILSNLFLIINFFSV